MKPLPRATPENIERHRRQVKDDARTVRPDKPLTPRERERVREAIHESLKRG